MKKEKTLKTKQISSMHTRPLTKYSPWITATVTTTTTPTTSLQLTEKKGLPLRIDTKDYGELSLFFLFLSSLIFFHIIPCFCLPESNFFPFRICVYRLPVHWESKIEKISFAKYNIFFFCYFPVLISDFILIFSVFVAAAAAVPLCRCLCSFVLLFLFSIVDFCVVRLARDFIPEWIRFDWVFMDWQRMKKKNVPVV